MHVITKLVVLLTTLEGIVGELAKSFTYCECEFQPWEEWSGCTKLCYGTEERVRYVRFTTYPGCDSVKDCASVDMTYEKRNCNEYCYNEGTFVSVSTGCLCLHGEEGRCCQIVNGGWTDYTLDNTGECSVTCGGGIRTLKYSRSCTNPSPEYGGDNCVGVTTKEDQGTCNTQHCPINGGWTDFTEWEEINECDALCGGGIKEEQRVRICTNPTPAYGGDDCNGELSQVRNVTCNTELCRGKCPNGRIKYIAHCCNKNKFYQCDNRVARLRECAPGTMWSQRHTVCINEAAAVLPKHAAVFKKKCYASDGLVADLDNRRNYRMCFRGRYITPCDVPLVLLLTQLLRPVYGWQKPN